MLTFKQEIEGICAICNSKDFRKVEKMSITRNDGQNVLVIILCQDCKKIMFNEFAKHMKES